MSQSPLPLIASRILAALDEQDEIQGTVHLATDVVATKNKTWVIVQARRLAERGEISITKRDGGRGHKTIYRRNRNSPGYPSRRDKHRRQIP